MRFVQLPLTETWRGALRKANVAALGLTCLASSVASLPVVAQKIAATSSTVSHARGDNNVASFGRDGSGTLLAMAASGKSLGQCPLKHTDVTANVSGYVARVRVEQTFQNPYKEKIEATYTFPLSSTGAVDSMVMKIGDRTIHGTIKKREEAKQIYETAKASGKVASLLDQERTNIFTQSVANIEPGQSIQIVIEYVELMPYESGQFTFAFPTVVGPRFIPGSPTGNSGTGWAHDTTQVPDASKITPPITAEGTRAGHDIAIHVHVNAGVHVNGINSKLHEVDIKRIGETEADITLKDKSTIPNKDFVLTWNVAGDELKSGYLTYRDPSNVANSKNESGYFALMMLPPKAVTPQTVAPREMIFLIDCSGSQHGAPLEKAKEAMLYIIERMNPNDTFQIISFSNGQTTLFDKPQKVSADMKARAKTFINNLTANGGTWMAPAVEQACAIAPDANRLRVVTFMTDGYVGNDYEVIGLIKKLRAKSRWFPFGTGNSVNRTLIDDIAKEGGGEPEYVLLNTSGEEVGSKFYKRIANPVLTDVKLDFDGVQVKEVFPKELADVWAERPLYFEGRYTKPGTGSVTISGFAAGKPYKQTLKLNFPEKNVQNTALSSIWARAKVDRLTGEDWLGAQNGTPNKELKDEIVQTALAHHIMTQYTSFVAVEEKTVTKGGAPIKVTVPVEMPDGVSREGVFGDRRQPGAMPFSPPMLQNFRSNGVARMKIAGGGGGAFNQAYNASGRGSVAAYAPQPTSAPAQESRVKADHLSGKLYKDEEKASSLALSKVVPAEVTPQRAMKERDKNDVGTAKKPNSSELSRLSEALKQLVQGNISAEQKSGLKIQDNKVLVKVTGANNAKLLHELERLGFKLVRNNSDGTIVGKAPINKLLRMAALNTVTKIEESSGDQ